MVVEGLTTAPVLRDLSRRLGIELPISEGVCAVLQGVPLTSLVEQPHAPRAHDGVGVEPHGSDPIGTLRCQWQHARSRSRPSR